MYIQIQLKSDVRVSICYILQELINVMVLFFSPGRLQILWSSCLRDPYVILSLIHDFSFLMGV